MRPSNNVSNKSSNKENISFIQLNQNLSTFTLMPATKKTIINTQNFHNQSITMTTKKLFTLKSQKYTTHKNLPIWWSPIKRKQKKNRKKPNNYLRKKYKDKNVIKILQNSWNLIWGKSQILQRSVKIKQKIK